MARIQVNNISKSFGAARVLNNITFDVEDGHFLTLLGPSGCGKTTLLRIIAGLEYSDEGEISIDGNDITNVPVEKRNIGFVFQNYALIPHMTVYNNIAYGLKLRKESKAAIRDKVEKYIALVGLEGLENRKIQQLSGGQQQRVALARALIIEPPILLLDEPLSALDRKIRGEMQYEIRRIQQETKITSIFVTHDQEEAMTMSDEILLLNAGNIEQMDTPEHLYNHPVSVYASDFLGKMNLLDGTIRIADGRTYAVGEGWQFEVADQNQWKDGQAVSVAVRGEQFLIRREPARNAAAAQIRGIFFTGEICRINLAIGSQLLTAACINMEAEQLHIGQTVYLEAPADKVHCFAKESKKEA